ncbi:hypothetical protein AtubIFM56815_002842 [Aspergillus tubingensis]|uniref:WD-like domain-containing protein n=2 Tax=Aspergillus subgen. Circumdati TaxID=2720871 RepID=A0A100I7X0_ASPNG|nr:uncharacterized protein AtWU_03830 [Aspergillus tubingensis]GAQ35621.1 hypothetical protein AKAW_10650 [Aspergillus niger]GFN14030.1 hypothetical protein AtWU_03830 [Aspergillus tubingensis]GLA65733.1 hypothetical protein AtubIFM54640_007926 [Aspergillus tubingensis]GLA88391.1 hypothetical protein AtubIFM56815_002842 [Aspergillus tubingensis]GLA94465.1 hypothetical protein AtubIFM57143_001450 [Aspergillus tubingensis]
MAGNPQSILKWLSLFAMVLGAFSGETDELFLDLDVDQVANGTAGSWIQAPWGESYVSAVRESRYGDAVWARYHMDGRAVGNIIEADNTTVTKELLDDATGYRLGNTELYNQVATRYNTTSSNDGHRELVDIIIGVLGEDLKALEKRDVTYTIKCSSSNLAPRSSCYELLQDMNQYQTDLGSTRTIDYYGGCWFRVGPHGSGADLTWYKAHAVGKLIYDDCPRTKACCSTVYVSGYSPKNSGHRKLCLSSKSTGC